MSQINSECLFFDDTDDETEVNSLLFGFLIDAALVIQASTPTIQKYQRSHMVRDRYGAHDRCDAVGKAGISALVKCTSAIRQLAYTDVPDSLDGCLQIGEKTSRDCLMHFCNGVIELYGEEYLRRLTQIDVKKLYAFHKNKLGFPRPFILLEAVASQDLWIWHAFFGVASLNNDVNVLRQSPILNDLKVRKAPEVPFVANDVTYKWGYYLTNGIYPEWAVLMKSISQSGSNDVKRIRYKQAHEAARKDSEEYLRRPTQTDVEKLYAFHEKKQVSWGDSGSEPFILLEAVASQDLWIWHAFFGVAGSNNDINVLRQSLVLDDLKVGKAP
ncbi:ALP1-like protein isoform X1 [Tanacetum coccineum]